MRIALISDIHGNYPALMNVVEDAALNNVDKMVFVGDYIFDLPFSNEVVRCLMKLENAHIIKGNKEAHLGTLANENQNNWTSDQLGGIYQTYRELAPDELSFLNELDDECRIEINSNLSIYAAHVPCIFEQQPDKTSCTSSNYHKRMLKRPFTHEQYLVEFNDIVNTNECKALIDQINSNVIVFGHNHLQAFAYCGDKLIINPGSCGQPLDFNSDAAYTILEVATDGLNVIERRVPYDVEAVIKQAKESVLYEKGRIWSELVFLALRCGRDYFGMYFEIAGQIARSKNEEGSFFSNTTWHEAWSVFEETI